MISLGCKKPLIWEKEATGSIKPSDTGQTCSDPKEAATAVPKANFDIPVLNFGSHWFIMR